MRFEVPGDRVRDFSFPVPGSFSETCAACREHGWAWPSLFRKASLPTLQPVSPLVSAPLAQPSACASGSTASAQSPCVNVQLFCGARSQRAASRLISTPGAVRLPSFSNFQLTARGGSGFRQKMVTAIRFSQSILILETKHFDERKIGGCPWLDSFFVPLHFDHGLLASGEAMYAVGPTCQRAVRAH